MKLRLFVITTVFAFRLSGQVTQVNTFPGVYYQRGVELFDEKKYNAAVSQLALYLQSDQVLTNRIEAEYYHSVSKMYAGHSDGEASVKRFLQNNPGSHKTHMANLAMGDYYYLKQKYSMALSYYKNVDQAAISKDISDRFYFRKGYCQINAKKYKDAAETLLPLTKRENEFKTLALYYYAYCAYYNGQYAEALSSFQSIENDGPKAVKLYIAQIFYLQNQYEKALVAADKINGGVPAGRVSFLKGKCHYRLGRYAQAADAFNASGMTLDSLDRNEVYEFGFANYKAEQCTNAVEWFKNIAYLGDSIAQYASYNLGDCYLKLRSKRDAMNAFAEAYRNGYNKEIAQDALLNQAKIAVELNESNAASLLQKYIASNGSSTKSKEAKKLLAGLLLNTDNYRDAAAVLESISDPDPQTEEAFQRVSLARGMELFKNRNWDEAAVMFDKCMAKSANRNLSGQAALWKAEVYIQQGKYNQVSELYQKFLDAPDVEDLEVYPFAFYGLGYSRYKDDAFGDAIPYFEKFIKTISRGRYDEKIYNDAQLRLGDCNYSQAARLGKDANTQKRKHMEDAITAYAYVTGKKGADADYALYQTGMLYGLQGQLFDLQGMREKKITAMKRLVADFPSSRYLPDAYFELGSEYWAAGSSREAERYYTSLVDEFKTHPLVLRCLLNLGRLYNNNGQSDKAVEMYTLLFDRFPGTPEAKSATENVKRIYTDQGKGSEFVKWTKNRGGMSASETDSLLYFTAFNMYERDKFKEAVSAFQEYLTEVDKGFFKIAANYYKAVCHEALKQTAEALPHFKIAAASNGFEFQEDAVLSVLEILGPNASCSEIMTYLIYLEQITRDKEKQHQAWKSMLKCYEQQNNYADGRVLATKIGTELSSTDDLKAEALVFLGKAAVQDKNWSDAMVHFKEAYTKYNNKFAAEAKYREAWVYYATDSFELTKEACYTLLDQFNSYDFWVGKSMLLLGDAFLKTKDEFNAKATWNSVAENFEIPELVAEAREKLARLRDRKSKTGDE
jgi:tetratricopeptide (TPR) repeat protein